MAYIGDQEQKLRDAVDANGKVPLKLALDCLKEVGETSVGWSEEDFEKRAREIEEDNAPKDCGIDFADTSKEIPAEFQLFDREEFGWALEAMIDKHDATIGITWDTVDHYLRTYCKITK